MPVLNRAAKAANARRDEDNKFQAAIHGIKWAEPDNTSKQGKIAKIKTAMINAPKGIKTISRAELKASGDG